jgi:hypothetical protein
MAFDSISQLPIAVTTVGLEPVVSLSAVSAVGAGTALDGAVVRSTAVMSTTTSAGVTAGAVQLQGSLDGTHWFTLGSAVSTTAAKHNHADDGRERLRALRPRRSHDRDHRRHRDRLGRANRIRLGRRSYPTRRPPVTSKPAAASWTGTFFRRLLSDRPCPSVPAMCSRHSGAVV